MGEAMKSTLAGLRILVVEDEFLVAEHIAMLLEDFGCEVVGPVPTVGEAIAIVDGEALDGALLDANLDGVSSASIADALSAQSVPFVVLTGYGSLELSAPKLEAAPRVTKPFDNAMLDRTMRAAFARTAV